MNMIKEEIIKEVKLSHDGSQYLFRIPKVIEKHLQIKKGDKIKIVISTKNDRRYYHLFKIIK